MFFKNYACILVLTILIVNVKGERQVTATLNPGCENKLCNDVILVHVKAEGENDTLHHLWDFTGKPSLLLALTDKNATLSVSWVKYALGDEGAVIIDPAPKYLYGMILDKLIEFNDEEDTGYLNNNSSNSSYVSFLDTKNFNWKFINLANSSGDATLTIEASEFKNTVTNVKKNGTVRVVVSAYGGEKHSDSLPRLLHSGNASQMDLILDGLSTKYKCSRFGLSFITVSSERYNDTLPDIKYRKTLDDEHAPGIFTIVEMVTPEVQKGGNGGYLQWRPVVYTSPSRDMTSSTETVQYHVLATPSPRQVLDHTLVFSLLGARLDQMFITSTNLTFGIAGDGFYHKNKYAAWSVLVGYGHPPEEHFSMLVTLVLLIGLGVPAILILTGTVCIVLRRLQRNKDALYFSR